MKTALEWFNELPNGYRELAITNYNNPKLNFGEKETVKLPKLINALGTFDWYDTKEGIHFWLPLYCHYYNNTELPPLPKKEQK